MMCHKLVRQSVLREHSACSGILSNRISVFLASIYRWCHRMLYGWQLLHGTIAAVRIRNFDSMVCSVLVRRTSHIRDPYSAPAGRLQFVTYTHWNRDCQSCKIATWKRLLLTMMFTFPQYKKKTCVDQSDHSDSAWVHEILTWIYDWIVRCAHVTNGHISETIPKIESLLGPNRVTRMYPPAYCQAIVPLHIDPFCPSRMSNLWFASNLVLSNGQNPPTEKNKFGKRSIEFTI